MIVLHFIQDSYVSGSLYLKYMPAIMAAMEKRADIHVLAPRRVTDYLKRNSGISGNGTEAAAYKIHTLSALRTLAGIKGSHIDRKLDEIKPDIVHIHACWSFLAYTLQRRCELRRIPVVLSFDRKLEPWHIAENYFTSKLPKLLAYQYRMVKSAYAIHAITRQECEDLKVLSPFNNIACMLSRKTRSTAHTTETGKDSTCRIVTIPHYAISGGISEDKMAAGLISLYNKVIDSNPFLFMDNDEIKAEDLLLTYGIMADKTCMQADKESESLFASLNSDSWKRIMLHSADEGITGYVKKGADALGIPREHTDIGEIARFQKNNYRVKTTCGNFEKKLDYIRPELPDKEKNLCVMLCSALSKARTGSLHRSDLSELCMSLRFNDYDEDLLRKAVSKLGIKGKIARLFQILMERYGLGEGFVFMDPINDKGTRKLKNKLFKANTQ